MARKIEIEIGAKDRTARAWQSLKNRAKSARQTMAKVGRASAAAFRGIVTGVGALAAALGAIGTVALKAFSKQEQAVADLSAAIRANGGDVETLIPRYKQFAAAIQDQTGAADESTLSLMAQIRNLGITDDKMEEATKGAIGLAKALRVDQASAARFAALALNGEFTTLQRYVPALRQATDEGEKMAIVQDLMRKGYEQASDALDTTAGRWDELKGRVGDATEVLGEAIAGSDGLKGSLAKLSKIVKSFGESGYIELWAQNVRKAIDFVSPTIKAFASKVGAVFSRVKLGIQQASAFAGGFAGGQGGLKSRAQAGLEAAQTIPQAIKKETQLRLKAIKEEKAAKIEAVKEVVAVQKEAIKEIVKDEERAAKNRLNIEQRITQLRQQHVAMNKQMADQQVDRANQLNLERANQAAFEMTPEGKAQAAAENARDDRLRRIREKEGRGIKLSTKDQLFKEQQQARMAVDAAQKQIEADRAKREQDAIDNAAKQRDEMKKAIEKQNILLAQNLQAK